MSIYENLRFPEAPANRPYTFINMVSTIDGKTVIGDRDDSAIGLGSKLDQTLMDRIESAANAVLLGGQTLRATPKSWNPKCRIRIGISRGGDIPFDSRFFTAEGAESFLVCPFNLLLDLPERIQRINAGKDEVDPVWLARYLRHDLNIERLHILGGSQINALFLTHNLVDELFLTLAPKIKLGRGLPTYAGGEPLPKDALQNYDLIEHHIVDSEVFLRYRRLGATSR